jgi:hypothetical protein
LNVFNVGIYQDTLNCLSENIREWDQTQSNFVPSGPQDFEAHNGYPPTLRLKAYKVSPHDGRMLQHILWRVTGKPDFNPFPSTYFGLKELPTADELDSYLDKHVEHILREEIQPDVTESELHQSTIKAVYDYGNGGKKLVATLGPGSRQQRLTIIRAPWYKRPCVSTLPRHSSFEIHGEFLVPTLLGCIQSITPHRSCMDRFHCHG